LTAAFTGALRAAAFLAGTAAAAFAGAAAFVAAGLEVVFAGAEVDDFAGVFFAALLVAVDELEDTNYLSLAILGAARPVPVNSRTHSVARTQAIPRIDLFLD
jgi:hypothetical protein